MAARSHLNAMPATPQPARRPRWYAGAVLALLLAPAMAALAAGPVDAPGQRLQALVDTARDPLLPDTIANFATSVAASGDARRKPYAVIDKSAARLWVFAPDGRLQAESRIIVGQAAGDTALSDIGTRPLSRVRPHEKITPAGRFETEPGENTHGEDIVWLDYDSALSMHRVRNVPGEHRLVRIRSDDVRQRRISFGCVNVPAGFYEQYIRPQFSDRAGVVYILPENAAVTSVFPFMRERWNTAQVR